MDDPFPVIDAGFKYAWHVWSSYRILAEHK